MELGGGVVVGKSHLVHCHVIQGLLLLNMYLLLPGSDQLGHSYCSY